MIDKFIIDIIYCTFLANSGYNWEGYQKKSKYLKSSGKNIKVFFNKINVKIIYGLEVYWLFRLSKDLRSELCQKY